MHALRGDRAHRQPRVPSGPSSHAWRRWRTVQALPDPAGLTRGGPAAAPATRRGPGWRPRPRPEWIARRPADVRCVESALSSNAPWCAQPQWAGPRPGAGRGRGATATRGRSTPAGGPDTRRSPSRWPDLVATATTTRSTGPVLGASSWPRSHALVLPHRPDAPWTSVSARDPASGGSHGGHRGGGFDRAGGGLAVSAARTAPHDMALPRPARPAYRHLPRFPSLARLAGGPGRRATPRARRSRCRTTAGTPTDGWQDDS